MRHQLRRLLVTAVAVGALVTVLPASATLAGKNPPGNNGTVKIGDLDIASHSNDPHVGCRFNVSFYGFDQGDLWASVTFEVHPPTGSGTILADTVFIGEDDNSGGGSPAGLDAVAVYDLNSAFVGFAPADEYHVKLTVQADGSQGAGTKHKTFWVGGCEAPPPTES